MKKVISYEELIKIFDNISIYHDNHWHTVKLDVSNRDIIYQTHHVEAGYLHVNLFNRQLKAKVVMIDPDLLDGDWIEMEIGDSENGMFYFTTEEIEPSVLVKNDSILSILKEEFSYTDVMDTLKEYPYKTQVVISLGNAMTRVSYYNGPGHYEGNIIYQSGCLETDLIYLSKLITDDKIQLEPNFFYLKTRDNLNKTNKGLWLGNNSNNTLLINESEINFKGPKLLNLEFGLNELTDELIVVK